MRVILMTPFTSKISTLEDVESSKKLDLMLSGENNTDYRLIIIHLIGVDHAAHNYGSNGYNEVERKLMDTEIIIKNTIEKMDNDTVLLIFGDHGMTDGGTHGGSSDKEIRHQPCFLIVNVVSL
jgi:phosphatidylinositol glycan class O